MLFRSRPDLDAIDDRILRRYNTLFDAFFEERSLIPPGQFHEVAFDDLEREPMREMERLYDRLNLPGFASAQPKLKRYLASISGYERNRFPELDPGLRGKVARAWRRSFDTWRYPD